MLSVDITIAFPRQLEEYVLFTDVSKEEIDKNRNYQNVKIFK